MSWRQLPNTITCIRIALVPVLVWAMREDDFRLAFWIALAAGASDALDGWLAKRFGWHTRLGGLLDPIADKLLLAACVIGLWSAGAIPTWLLALVVGRDLVIVSGALAYQGFIGPVEAQPSQLSKITTALQIAFVLGALLVLAWDVPLPRLAWQMVQWIVAAFTLMSGVDYVWVWSRRAREAHSAEKSR